MFEFRGCKKPVIKPPPPVGDAGAHDEFETHGVVSSAPLSKHGMMEYIGFVSIMLSRGKDLVPAGFVGKVNAA